LIPLRDENPRHSFPLVTLLIILVNVLIFFYQLGLGATAQLFVFDYGVIPVEVITGKNLPQSPNLIPYVSVLTSMFLHGGFLHLLGNMWYLWIFGDNIEDFLGRFQFAAFYIACGVSATLTHIGFERESLIPLVGASGAISGVQGAYIFLHPRIRILTLVPIGIFITTLRIPAIYFIGIWAAMQFLGFMQPTGQVAYGAHIGGFLAGILLIVFMSVPSKRKRSSSKPWTSGRAPRGRPKY
jgi:membrane associated rhomboid family serine protease